MHNYKNTRNRITVALSVAILAGSLSANALVIDLGAWSPPQGQGESAATELAFLNSTVLPAYNAANNPDVSAATSGTANIGASSDDLTTIALDLTGWSYLKLKWGHQWQFYSIVGENGNGTFNSTVFNQNGKPQALSHYTFFGPDTGGNIPGVPDGGSTLLMIGLALSGLSVWRRWLAS